MRYRRAGIAVMARVMGIIAVCVAVAALILVVNADAGLEGSTGTARYGWLAPLVAASVIGVVAWLLLGESSDHDDQPPSPSQTSVCPECGRSVLKQWRMCPYCGEMLEDSTVTHSSPVDS